MTGCFVICTSLKQPPQGRLCRPTQLHLLLSCDFHMTVIFWDCDESLTLVEKLILHLRSHDGCLKWLSWELEKIFSLLTNMNKQTNQSISGNFHWDRDLLWGRNWVTQVEHDISFPYADLSYVHIYLQESPHPICSFISRIHCAGTYSSTDS